MSKRSLTFSIQDITFLRYFGPLAAKSKDYVIKCNFYLDMSGNKPTSIQHHLKYLKTFCEKFKCNIITEPYDKGVCMLIEGVGKNIHKLPTYSVTYMSDFRTLYDSYINDVDYVLMPSLKVAQHFNKLSNKNLYLGSPKYGAKLDKEFIYNKYNLPKDKKYALFIYPNSKYQNIIDFKFLYNILRENGYSVIVKGRSKDKAPKENRGDYYFEDFSWYPHTTMELLTISDFLVNTESTTVKEAILLKTPIINLKVKTHDNHFSFLKNDDFWVDINKEDVNNEWCINNAISFAKKANQPFKFAKTIKEDLFLPGSTSRILLHVSKQF